MIARTIPFPLLVGCVYPDSRSQADIVQEAAAKHKAAWDRQEAIHQAQLQREAQERHDADVQRIADKKKADEDMKVVMAEAKVSALVARCAEDRDLRHARLDAHLKSYDDRNKLLDWEDAHCKIVDHGKSVVREYEQPNGVIVKRRIISGYPVRECDAKEPKGLPPYRVGTSYRYQGVVKLSESEHQKNQACLDLDLAAGWDHVDRDEEEAKK